jgi:hypothetical protein
LTFRDFNGLRAVLANWISGLPIPVLDTKRSRRRGVPLAIGRRV